MVVHVMGMITEASAAAGVRWKRQYGRCRAFTTLSIVARPPGLVLPRNFCARCGSAAGGKDCASHPDILPVNIRRPAKRPANSRLNCSRLEEILDSPCPLAGIGRRRCRGSSSRTECCGVPARLELAESVALAGSRAMPASGLSGGTFFRLSCLGKPDRCLLGLYFLPLRGLELPFFISLISVSTFLLRRIFPPRSKTSCRRLRLDFRRFVLFVLPIFFAASCCHIILLENQMFADSGQLYGDCGRRFHFAIEDYTTRRKPGTRTSGSATASSNARECR